MSDFHTCRSCVYPFKTINVTPPEMRNKRNVPLTSREAPVRIPLVDLMFHRARDMICSRSVSASGVSGRKRRGLTRRPALHSTLLLQLREASRRAAIRSYVVGVVDVVVVAAVVDVVDVDDDVGVARIDRAGDEAAVSDEQ